LAWFCVFTGSALILGCAVKGTVVDVNGNKTSVKRIQLSPRSEMLVLDGASTRTVRLGSIEKLVIEPDRSMNRGGRLFYGADIEFRETDEPYGNENSKPNTYIGVGGYLTGRSRAGTYRIPLDQISEVDFVYE
jgi:hypothetical protein